ncbi:MAG: Unknown protein [uncultured Sulfurovum sp.]|uniref:PD-(D/E)XK nuclease superfamily protein n=1 Tax=uncultured Sulfurovum sp. TaxID=269237 RepID=A0A6S6SBR8_9BACT|nr:MAG: Unknown protein [uncultured Sulfurovum sp.]
MTENEKTEEQIKIIQKFIFNDDVQETISNINDNLMDFNILEITGMGNQEIKHSNIVGWLFDDSEHNLEYHLLDNFLKKAIEENKNDKQHEQILDTLKSYIYLAKNKRNITIYREKDNIDLLIVDEANKVVITIENKVDATERIEGEDGGQLQKYEDIVNKKYDINYKKYFLFLTINLEKPSRDNWLRVSHQMINDVVENTIKTKDITIKTEIILESYVDLLKRNGIVKNKKLEELCKKIWDNEDYQEALKIILNNRPNISDDITNWITNIDGARIIETKVFSGVDNFFIQLNDKSPLIFRLVYSPHNRLGILITSKNKDNIDDEIIFKNKLKFKKNNNSKGQFNYSNITNYLKICDDKDIDESRIINLLKQLNELDKNYIY